MGTPGDDAVCIIGELERMDVAAGVEDEPGPWCEASNAVAATPMREAAIAKPPVTSVTCFADHSRFLPPSGCG